LNNKIEGFQEFAPGYQPTSPKKGPPKKEGPFGKGVPNNKQEVISLKTNSPTRVFPKFGKGFL